LIALLEAVREHWAANVWVALARATGGGRNSMVRSRGGWTSCACSRTWSGEGARPRGRFRPPTSSCRPMPSSQAAWCCRPPRRYWVWASSYQARCLYFADRRMKARTIIFAGFPGAVECSGPSICFLLHLPPALSSLAVATLIVLTFCSIPRDSPGTRGAPCVALPCRCSRVWAVLAIVVLVKRFQMSARS